MDLDSDNRIIQQNKYREAYNIDITREGNNTAVTDLEGETVIGVLEQVVNDGPYILAVEVAQFLEAPTGKTSDAFIFFYIKENAGERKFVIKAMFRKTGLQDILFEETLTQGDFEMLKTSTISTEKVGNFGYDVVYFVDNRRQPRKLECVVYRTNSAVVTLHGEGVVAGNDYIDVNLRADISGSVNDPFRAYIYAYKNNSTLIQAPNNPLTETIKFAYFDGSSNSANVTFRIYGDDYAAYTFILRYHREGVEVYRNFNIGIPDRVDIPVGVLVNQFVLKESPSNTPAQTQLFSWDFIYNGSILTAYMDTPSIAPGTRIYRSNIARESALLSDGFYQNWNPSSANAFVRIQNGAVVESSINFANISFATWPVEIEPAVRAGALEITEGSRQRLSTVSYNLPATVTHEGKSYTYLRTAAGTKESISTTPSFVIERRPEIAIVAYYRSQEVVVMVSVIDVQEVGSGLWRIVYLATLGSNDTLSDDIELAIVHPVSADGMSLVPNTATAIIPFGENFSQTESFYSGMEGQQLSFGGACIDFITYNGTETVVNGSVCSS